MRTLKDLMMEYPVSTLLVAIRAAKAKHKDYLSKPPAEKLSILVSILQQ